jgi:hypothetical protein
VIIELFITLTDNKNVSGSNINGARECYLPFSWKSLFSQQSKLTCSLYSRTWKVL